MLRVLIVDDHPVVRRGIASLLEEAGLEVVGQAGDGLDALALEESLRPDVAVIDLMLPGLSGFEVARRIAARGRTRVLVLTLHANDAYAVQALSDGADGFVIKDAHPDEIVRAVRTVAAGKRHFPPRLAESRGSTVARDPWDTLTPREREVAQLLGEGLPMAESGLRLGISPRTVEVHRGNLMRKLHLGSTVELVRLLVRRGILSAVE